MVRAGPSGRTGGFAAAAVGGREGVCRAAGHGLGGLPAQLGRCSVACRRAAMDWVRAVACPSSWESVSSSGRTSQRCSSCRYCCWAVDRAAWASSYWRAGGLALQLLPLGSLLLKLLQSGLGILQPGAERCQAAPAGSPAGQRILQLGDFLLQCRDLSGGAVGSPGVQLLFQPLIALGVGGVLLASGDQSSDAALQLGVLIHRQSILTDEGAAQKHLPWNAQQILTGLGGEDAGDGIRAVPV